MFDTRKAKELCEKATLGPWKADGRVVEVSNRDDESWGKFIGECDEDADAEFMAEARTLLPNALENYSYVVMRLGMALELLDKVDSILLCDIDPRRTDILDLCKKMEAFDPERYNFSTPTEYEEE